MGIPQPHQPQPNWKNYREIIHIELKEKRIAKNGSFFFQLIFKYNRLHGIRIKTD